MRNRLLSHCLWFDVGVASDVGVYAEESVNERLVPSNSLATAFSHFGDNLYFFHFRGFTLVIACWSRQSTSFGKENKLSCLWCLWLCYFGTRQIMTRHRRCFLPLAQSKQNLWLIETDNAGGRGGAIIICYYCSPTQVTTQNNNATGKIGILWLYVAWAPMTWAPRTRNTKPLQLKRKNAQEQVVIWQLYC